MKTPTPTVNKGDLVQFRNPNPDENRFPMRVIWTDGPRAMIEDIIPGWSILPTQIVLLSDLEPKG